MSNQELIERIKKCLALASNNSNENEVRNAMKMAQTLALKSNIDIDSIELFDDVKKQDVVNDKLNQNTKNFQMWRYRLCKVISDNFKVGIYVNRDYRGSWIGLIGEKDSIEIAKQVFAYAEAAYISLSKKFIDSVKLTRHLNRSITVRLKNDYFEGFLKGIDEAFKENVEEMGLIVIKPDEVIQFMGGLSQTKRKSAVRSGDAEAQERGKSDGHLTGQQKRHEYVC